MRWIQNSCLGRILPHQPFRKSLEQADQARAPTLAWDDCRLREIRRCRTSLVMRSHEWNSLTRSCQLQNLALGFRSPALRCQLRWRVYRTAVACGIAVERGRSRRDGYFSANLGSGISPRQDFVVQGGNPANPDVIRSVRSRQPRICRTGSKIPQRSPTLQKSPVRSVSFVMRRTGDTYSGPEVAFGEAWCHPSPEFFAKPVSGQPLSGQSARSGKSRRARYAAGWLIVYAAYRCASNSAVFREGLGIGI